LVISLLGLLIEGLNRFLSLTVSGILLRGQKLCQESHRFKFTAQPRLCGQSQLRSVELLFTLTVVHVTELDQTSDGL
jgi:hypothetical protein